MKPFKSLTTLALGGMIAMAQLAVAQAPDAATDTRIDPQVSAFLAELNKDSSPFWELDTRNEHQKENRNAICKL